MFRTSDGRSNNRKGSDAAGDSSTSGKFRTVLRYDDWPGTGVMMTSELVENGERIRLGGGMERREEPLG
jgi:hypothetical protein